MGIIFSKFRKKRTNVELLQKVEDDIKEIEEYRSSTEQRHKRIVGQLLVYSVGLYVIFGVFCYFYFPTTLKLKIVYTLPFLLFPLILILLKKLISWYYVRKLNSNQNKLTEMRKEKKRLLEEVMDKETYKVAKDILEKFAPENLPRKPQVLQVMPRAVTPMVAPNSELRRRSNTSVAPAGGELLPLPALQTPKSSLMPLQAVPPPYTSSAQPGSADVPRKPLLPLPAPIIDKERPYLDRVVEYLVGDGPGSRYALICKQCHSHNGMALQEEFEYLGFRCCYCFVYNPARKQRPEAPKLAIKGKLFTVDSETEESDTVSTEGSDGQSEGKVEAPTPDDTSEVAEKESEMREEGVEEVEGVKGVEGDEEVEEEEGEPLEPEIEVATNDTAQSSTPEDQANITSDSAVAALERLEREAQEALVPSTPINEATDPQVT